MLWKRESRHFLSHTIVCAFEKTLSCLPYPDCNLKIAIHKILMIGPGNLFIDRFFGGLIFGLGRGEGGVSFSEARNFAFVINLKGTWRPKNVSCT